MSQKIQHDLRYRKPYSHSPGLQGTPHGSNNTNTSSTNLLDKAGHFAKSLHRRIQRFTVSPSSNLPTQPSEPLHIPTQTYTAPNPIHNNMDNTSTLQARNAQTGHGASLDGGGYFAIVMGAIFGIAGLVAGGLYVRKRRRDRCSRVIKSDKEQQAELGRHVDRAPMSRPISLPLQTFHVATGSPEHTYFPPTVVRQPQTGSRQAPHQEPSLLAQADKRQYNARQDMQREQALRPPQAVPTLLPAQQDTRTQKPPRQHKYLPKVLESSNGQIPLITAQIITQDRQPVLARPSVQSLHATKPIHQAQQRPGASQAGGRFPVSPFSAANAKLKAQDARREPLTSPVPYKRLTRPGIPALTVKTNVDPKQSKPQQITKPAASQAPANTRYPVQPRWSHPPTTPLFTPPVTSAKDLPTWAHNHRLNLIANQQRVAKEGIAGQVWCTSRPGTALVDGESLAREEAETLALGAKRVQRERDRALEMLEGKRVPRLSSAREWETDDDVAARWERIRAQREWEREDPKLEAQRNEEMRKAERRRREDIMRNAIRERADRNLMERAQGEERHDRSRNVAETYAMNV
ncbi:MAG: hypothetical protein M1828_001085 [Chrysothrix sp. TS-e1954]|nr:MAG: hypothetical protein M1828_001085 [Chrysothrix sp. TS-e1954]